MYNYMKHCLRFTIITYILSSLQQFESENSILRQFKFNFVLSLGFLARLMTFFEHFISTGVPPILRVNEVTNEIDSIQCRNDFKTRKFS